jgi:hypothetical protein
MTLFPLDFDGHFLPRDDPNQSVQLWRGFHILSVGPKQPGITTQCNSAFYQNYKKKRKKKKKNERKKQRKKEFSRCHSSPGVEFVPIIPIHKISSFGAALIINEGSSGGNEGVENVNFLTVDREKLPIEVTSPTAACPTGVDNERNPPVWASGGRVWRDFKVETPPRSLEEVEKLSIEDNSATDTSGERAVSISSSGSGSRAEEKSTRLNRNTKRVMTVKMTTQRMVCTRRTLMGALMI